MDANKYGEAIVRVHRAFDGEPEKAGALSEALNLLVDRIRAVESENAALTRSLRAAEAAVAALQKKSLGSAGRLG